jgi:hypothetical protein
MILDPKQFSHEARVKGTLPSELGRSGWVALGDALDLGELFAERLGCVRGVMEMGRS